MRSQLTVVAMAVCTTTACGGSDGENGSTALVSVESEPAGENCALGGYAIRSGLDDNDNGSLDASEADQEAFVCNGDGTPALVEVSEEPPGASCSSGGQKISAGIDDNGNGIFDENEVQSVSYVCNGETGTDTTTFITAEPAGTNCDNGGVKVQTGTDSDHDGQFSASELGSPVYVCNGADGLNSITHQTALPKGSTECPGGGVKIETGLDVNQDGVLDSAEVTQSTTLCTPLVCDRAARFSLDTQVACPEDKPYAQLPVVGGNWTAVTASGDLFVSVSGGGQDHVAKIQNNGTVDLQWYLGPLNGGNGGDLAALGQDIYLMSPKFGQNNIYKLDASSAALTVILDQTGNTSYEPPIAVFDASNVYFSSQTLFKVSSGTASDLQVSVGNEMIADPVKGRLYFVAVSGEVKYLTLPITSASVPVTLASLGALNPPPATVPALAVDDKGMVFASCLDEVNGLPAPCKYASVFRIHPETGEVSLLVDNFRPVTGLAFNGATHQLHMMRMNPDNSLAVERVDILR